VRLGVRFKEGWKGVLLDLWIWGVFVERARGLIMWRNVWKI
jgi:hypothetical protein